MLASALYVQEMVVILTQAFNSFKLYRFETVQNATSMTPDLLKLFANMPPLLGKCVLLFDVTTWCIKILCIIISLIIESCKYLQVFKSVWHHLIVMQCLCCFVYSKKLSGIVHFYLVWIFLTDLRVIFLESWNHLTSLAILPSNTELGSENLKTCFHIVGAYVLLGRQQFMEVSFNWTGTLCHSLPCCFPFNVMSSHSYLKCQCFTITFLWIDVQRMKYVVFLVIFLSSEGQHHVQFLNY